MPRWATARRRWRPKPYRPEYGATHRAKRRALAPLVARGVVNCARCDEPIEPGQEWDLGHVDGDRLRYAGPEHRRSRLQRGRKPSDVATPQASGDASRADAAEVARVVSPRGSVGNYRCAYGGDSVRTGDGEGLCMARLGECIAHSDDAPLGRRARRFPQADPRSGHPSRFGNPERSSECSLFRRKC